MTARIDVAGKPPTSGEIAAWRREAGSAQEVAFQAMLLTPLPVLDMVVGAAAGGVDHLLNGSAREALEDDVEATARDWSGVAACESYVAQVRAMKRPLVRAETEALERLLTYDGLVRHGVAAAIETAAGTVVSLFRGKAA